MVGGPAAACFQQISAPLRLHYAPESVRSSRGPVTSHLWMVTGVAPIGTPDIWIPHLDLKILNDKTVYKTIYKTYWKG